MTPRSTSICSRRSQLTSPGSIEMYGNVTACTARSGADLLSGLMAAFVGIGGSGPPSERRSCGQVQEPIAASASRPSCFHVGNVLSCRRECYGSVLFCRGDHWLAAAPAGDRTPPGWQPANLRVVGRIASRSRSRARHPKQRLRGAVQRSCPAPVARIAGQARQAVDVVGHGPVVAVPAVDPQGGLEQGPGALRGLWRESAAGRYPWLSGASRRHESDTTPAPGEDQLRSRRSRISAVPA